MPVPQIHVPPARPEAVRALGESLPLSPLLPRPVHYVMAGGGSRGSVQWGLLQALSETDVRPHAIIGTSAGALSGVVLAEDPLSGMNRLSYVWAQLDSRFVVGESWWGSLSKARHIALAENTAVRETLESVVAARDFADLALPFAAVATDLASGSPAVIDSGPLIPALLASSAIPGLLPPVEVQGRLLVDGLASANLPAIQAVQRGAGSVVVLDTGGRHPGETSMAARRVISRLAVALSASQRRDQLCDAAAEIPVVLLPTPGNLGSTLDFSDTMSAASDAYAMARDFLADLVQRHDDLLPAGLYARSDTRGIDAAVREVLQAVDP